MKLKRKEVCQIDFYRWLFLEIKINSNDFFTLFFTVERRLEFQRRRKAHYNEFEAVRLARKLIEEEDDVDEDANDGNESKTIKSKDTPSTSDKCQIGDSDVGACSEEMTNEQS